MKHNTVLNQAAFLALTVAAVIFAGGAVYKFSATGARTASNQTNAPAFQSQLRWVLPRTMTVGNGFPLERP
jgi:hypothetical protein